VAWFTDGLYSMSVDLHFGQNFIFMVLKSWKGF